MAVAEFQVRCGLKHVETVYPYRTTRNEQNGVLPLKCSSHFLWLIAMLLPVGVHMICWYPIRPFPRRFLRFPAKSVDRRQNQELLVEAVTCHGSFKMSDTMDPYRSYVVCSAFGFCPNIFFLCCSALGFAENGVQKWCAPKGPGSFPVMISGCVPGVPPWLWTPMDLSGSRGAGIATGILGVDDLSGDAPLMEAGLDSLCLGAGEKVVGRALLELSETLLEALLEVSIGL